MTWFAFALLGYFFLAVVFILDKFILTESVERPVVYTFYSTIFMLAAFVLVLFGGGPLTGIDWWIALISGVSFGFGLWAMFTAVKRGEASHINPFIGAVVTVSTFGLAALFLEEVLQQNQIVGMVVLFVATLFLSLETKKKGTGFHIGFLWAAVAGFLFAVSHITAKYIYDAYPFVTGFMWTRAFTGIVGLLCLFSPHVRSVFHLPKKPVTATTGSNNVNFGKKHAIGIVVADKALGIVGVVLIQYAIAVGSVTLVNAMVGLQYALMFLLIYLLTRFAPKIFNEYFTRRELITQIAAIFLVAIGSALFVL